MSIVADYRSSAAVAVSISEDVLYRMVHTKKNMYILYSKVGQCQILNSVFYVAELNAALSQEY